LEEKRKAEEEKKAAEDKLTKSKAHVEFHNLAQKTTAGVLPLPFTYKFLSEIFRCTEQIAAMLHNRKEIITVEKLKTGVQTMLRKNFSLDYIKQIKTVFPAAYKYAWENVLGRYGKVLSEFELHITVNLNYKNDTISEFGGEGHKAEEILGNERLVPAQVVERRTLFGNNLQQIMRQHHRDFCAKLSPPVTVDDSKVQHYHQDFNVDQVPAIPLGELPEKPHVEVCTTASEVLQKSRALFETNPKLAETLSKIAEVKKEAEAVPVVAAAPAPVRKELSGLPQGLLEKIRAKEAAKKASEMFTDKGKEERVKQLRRLPTLARILRNTLIAEKKAALPQPFILKKATASYPGHLALEVLTKDVDKLVELTKPFAMYHLIQGTKYFKVNQSMDINKVVAELEKKLEEEMKK